MIHEIASVKTGSVAACPVDDAPQPVTYADVWSLDARPAEIEGAASAWRGYAAQAERAANNVDSQATALYDGKWQGRTADEFELHRRKLTGDMRNTADIASEQAKQLDIAANILRTRQHWLDGVLARLKSMVTACRDGKASTIVFYPKDAAQTQIVTDGVAEAEAIRRDIDGGLYSCETALRRLTQQWQTIASTWEPTAGGAAPFTMPPEATGPSVIFDGNTAIVNTGPGDDTIRVYVDKKTGEPVVVSNDSDELVPYPPRPDPSRLMGGFQYRFPAGTQVVVRTGEGDDDVLPEPGTRTSLTLLGGAGNDCIFGGEGGDYIFGGAGNDRIFGYIPIPFDDKDTGHDFLSGGAGNDSIYGGTGNNIFSGGAGDDDIKGSWGDDQISGGSGDDYLWGNSGDDYLDGGPGDDAIVGGPPDVGDNDVLRGGPGDNMLRPENSYPEQVRMIFRGWGR